ncbi:hypothetical protein ACIGCM_07470 [Pseudomonas sp. NPDC078700]|uniref:hypothetical protein n=1 Tax=Pseudomonas sp. NPDC078700 TaxID=3364424 RepID=UPI0037C7B53C
MPVKPIGLALLLSFALLSGCGVKDTPQAALDKEVQQLQDNLEAKKTSAVMDQLHPEFAAQQQFDHDWAKRTMTLMFLRYKNVKVIALTKDNKIDPTYSSKGYTDAQVAMTGAEGLIPDSARHYAVRLEWWRDGDDWKLARLSWQ